MQTRLSLSLPRYQHSAMNTLSTWEELDIHALPPAPPSLLQLSGIRYLLYLTAPKTFRSLVRLDIALGIC